MCREKGGWPCTIQGGKTHCEKGKGEKFISISKHNTQKTHGGYGKNNMVVGVTNEGYYAVLSRQQKKKESPQLMSLGEREWLEWRERYGGILNGQN